MLTITITPAHIDKLRELCYIACDGQIAFYEEKVRDDPELPKTFRTLHKKYRNWVLERLNRRLVGKWDLLKTEYAALKDLHNMLSYSKTARENYQNDEIVTQLSELEKSVSIFMNGSYLEKLALAGKEETF